MGDTSELPIREEQLIFAKSSFFAYNEKPKISWKVLANIVSQLLFGPLMKDSSDRKYPK
jgi:hypothetical protein